MSKVFQSRSSRLSAALVRNKGEQCRLKDELRKLYLHKRTEMRILNNDIEKFKNKYDRRSISSPTAVDISSEITQEIHSLLFTNDEIDVEKILCLYLISAHRAETLSPQTKRLSAVCKIHSPVERLLERSKRKINVGHHHGDGKPIHTLPLYTVELADANSVRYGITINDGRLATRILINQKIRDLINSVLTALKDANYEKFEEIIEIMNDPDSLEVIFERPHVSEFLQEISNFSIINSCESFVLTPPYKTKSIQLEIKTKAGSLERLIKHIRQSLLQLPTKKIPDVLSVEAEFEAEGSKLSLPGKEDFNFGNKIWPRLSEKKMSPKKSNKKVSKEPTDDKEEYSLRRTFANVFDPLKPKSNYKEMSNRVNNVATEANSPLKHVSSAECIQYLYKTMNLPTNFVKKNIKEAAKVSRNSPLLDVADDENEDIELIKKKNKRYSEKLRKGTQDSDSPYYANRYQFSLQTQIEKEKIQSNIGNKYVENNLESCPSEVTTEYSDQNKPAGVVTIRSIPNFDAHTIKARLKQTTCPACMERWRTPLPTPKVPGFKKNILALPEQSLYLHENSERRMAVLIAKEMYRLSRDRYFPIEEARKVLMRRKAHEDTASDYTYLSPIELAKIEQEVREKETRKKLQQFLNDKNFRKT